MVGSGAKKQILHLQSQQEETVAACELAQDMSQDMSIASADLAPESSGPSAPDAPALPPTGNAPCQAAATVHETAGPLLPLAYILQVMRDPAVEIARRDDMAKLALPYLHAKPVAAEPARAGEAAEAGEPSLLEVGRRIAFALGAVTRADQQENSPEPFRQPEPRSSDPG